MAQHKYDLVTVPTHSTGPPRHHPWYKERLDLKFAKHGHKPACLDGRKWTLLAGNMDDFRTGVPIDHSTVVVKGRVDPVPLVESSQSLLSRRVSSEKRQRLPSFSQPLEKHGPGHTTLHSRVGPRCQSKVDHLRQLEERLLQNPLSLYPHLRNSIPTEVAEDVMSILDTGTTPETVFAQRQHEAHCYNLAGQEIKEEKSSEDDKQDEPEVFSAQETIYRWPLKQTEEEMREEERALADQKVISPAQEARVSEVTHNLVQWGRDLGGSEQAVNINESRVKNLFTSDYETRLMTAPLNVAEFPNVPLELERDTPRLSASTRHSSLWEGDGVVRRRSLTTPALFCHTYTCDRPRYVKSRYGAWYLPLHLWKLQRTDEPLRDPRKLTSESTEELARQDEELDYRVSQLHGAQAFRDYYSTRRPGLSMPSFLQRVTADCSSQNFYHR